MKTDAEYVDEVMSQSLLKSFDSVKEGENDAYLRKRALSWEEASESSKKMKQLNPMEGNPPARIGDLLDLMRTLFTSFCADLQDMHGEVTSTFENRFTSFETKHTDTVMKVVHVEIDSVKKDF